MTVTGMCALAFATDRPPRKPPLMLSSDLVQKLQSRKVNVIIHALQQTIFVAHPYC